jgi:hypothetical protein
MPVPPIRTWRRPHVYERFSRERPVLLCSSKPPPLIPIVSGTTPHLACSPHLLGASINTRPVSSRWMVWAELTLMPSRAASPLNPCPCPDRSHHARTARVFTRMHPFLSPDTQTPVRFSCTLSSTKARQQTTPPQAFVTPQDFRIACPAPKALRPTRVQARASVWERQHIKRQ